MLSSGDGNLLLAILNLTPDSFSGGMGDASYEDCIASAKRMLHFGATHIDIGAESTRPGAEAISVETEWARLEPFLTLAKRDGMMQFISVDSRKPTIMKRAAAMGVSFINCVGPLPPTQILQTLKSSHPRLNFLACHMFGEPKTMQDNPAVFDTALEFVTKYFNAAKHSLQSAGFSNDEIYLDPGIGFGKSDEANWALLKETSSFAKHFNLGIGISRKGFIGRALDIPEPRDRDPASNLIEYAQVLAGAKLIRTHNVRGFRKLQAAVEGVAYHG